MKKYRIFIVLFIFCFASIFMSARYRQLKSAYWIVHFLAKYSDVSTNNPQKDARYLFVLRDNGNYIINQRKTHLGLILTYFIENQNDGLNLTRTNFESWILDNGDRILLKERIAEKLENGVKIEFGANERGQ